VPKVRLHRGEKARGLSIHVLTNDEHPPAHVHVFKGERPAGPSCRIKLGGPGDVADPDLEPILWDVSGPSFTLREAWLAEQLVRRHRTECWAAWRKYNGHL